MGTGGGERRRETKVERNSAKTRLLWIVCAVSTTSNQPFTPWSLTI